jgi:hypothetical protein
MKARRGNEIRGEERELKNESEERELKNESEERELK